MTNEPNVLRGNIEAGLRLLLKSEKPIYRRTAEVGIEDLNGLFEQLQTAQNLLVAERRWREETQEQYGTALDALRSIESMAGAGGSGEIPAMPIAAKAREVLYPASEPHKHTSIPTSSRTSNERF